MGPTDEEEEEENILFADSIILIIKPTRCTDSSNLFWE